MNKEDNSDKSEIFNDISHFEFLAYGTIQIFEKRANNLRTLRSWLTFLGIILPVTVGGIYLSFGKSETLMESIVFAAGIIGTFQLFLSTWALVAGWDSSYESAIKSVQGNTTIYNKCKRFRNYNFSNEHDLFNSYNELLKEVENQELVDLTQHITASERKYAYVTALSYYNRECHACNQNPNIHDKKIKCTSCGQKKSRE